MDFPYIENDDITLLRQEPEEMIAQEVKEERRDMIRKGFKPFIRANSMSSSSGSVATVTMNTIRRMVNLLNLHY